MKREFLSGPAAGERILKPGQPLFVRGMEEYCEVHPRQPYQDTVVFYYSYSLSPHYLDKVRVIPDGCIDLYFLCDRNDPRAYVVGTPTKLKKPFLPSVCDYFGMRFWPGMAHPFFPCFQREFTDAEVALDNILAEEGRRLAEQITTASTLQERICMVNAFLSRHLSHPSRAPLWMRDAITMIFQYRGCLKMSWLEEYFGYSSRYLRMMFEQYVGISPKKMCRTVRFQSMLKEMKTSRRHDLLDVALAHGYYDQSHFDHEFQLFCGSSPGRFHSLCK